MSENISCFDQNSDVTSSRLGLLLKSVVMQGVKTKDHPGANRQQEVSITMY